MPYFADEHAVHEHLGGLFRDALDDDKARNRLTKVDTIVQLQLDAPRTTITVKLLPGQAGQVDLGVATLRPECALVMSADTAHRFFLGRVNPTTAFSSGEIKTRGPVVKLLRLVPLVGQLAGRYEERLREAGLEQLLADTPPAEGVVGTPPPPEPAAAPAEEPAPATAEEPAPAPAEEPAPAPAPEEPAPAAAEDVAPTPAEDVAPAPAEEAAAAPAPAEEAAPLVTDASPLEDAAAVEEGAAPADPAPAPAEPLVTEASPPEDAAAIEEPQDSTSADTPAEGDEKPDS
jgi:putative sterol carrier protein